MSSVGQQPNSPHVGQLQMLGNQSLKMTTMMTVAATPTSTAT
jgi:hypothetical protein